MAKSTVAVRFTGDTTALKRSLSGVDGQLKGLDGRIGGLSGRMKVGLATAGGAAVVFGKKSLDAASDTEESWSKMETVFGAASEKVGQFAKDADQIGLSDQKAADALGTFGNLFDQLGIGADRSADLSTQMVTLAADLGSFHNADISEVIEAQSSAFRGEYDALQRFIPTISAATVEQKALEQTGKKSTKELTAQEKALAVQTLMMEGAGKATGDFERTSDSAANKQRVLSAKFDDLSAKVGQKLIPILTQLADIGIRIIDFFSNLSPEMQVAIGVVGGLAAVVFTIVKAVQMWTAVQTALNAVLAMNPIGLIILAVAAFVAGLVIAYKKVGWFRDLVDGAFKLIKTVIETAFNWVKNNWPLLLAILTGPIGLAVLAIVKHWDTIKAGVTAVKDWIVTTFNDITGFITGLPGKITDAASGMFDGIKDAFKSALNWIIRGWNNLEFKIPGFDPPGPGPKFGGFTLGVPNIPTLHSGTPFFRPPNGAREGLALLERGEAITPASQNGGMMTIQLVVDGRVLAETVRRHDRGLR